MKVFITLVVLICLIESVVSIRCYKCRGDEECNFSKRQIYIDNCTWASRCWGARIGDHYIRGCADDRCNVQLGLASYIESKCCYKDFCNDQYFFMPSSASKSKQTNVFFASFISAFLYFRSLSYN